MKSSSTELELIQPNILNGSEGVQAWFTCKNAGYNRVNQHIPGLNIGFNTNEKEEIVEQHRKDLLSKLKIDERDIAYAGQVHGNRVQVVTGGGTYADTDALITQIPGLALAIQVADCAAILLADDSKNIIAAVHAGWRGAAGDILPNAIKKMMALGAQAKNIKAFISPCISQKNFEVGKEVAEQFPDQFVDYHSYKKPHIDLKEFLRKQMQDMGLNPDHIEVHPGCTVDEYEQYYSYRREHEKSGRMLGLIRLYN